VLAEARSFPAWIRFSNGSPMPKEDRVGDVRGMAIKLVGVPGSKLLPDERDAVTQDFVLVDFPRFFLRDGLEYVPFTKLALQGRRDVFFDDKPDRKAILDAMEGRSVDHLFAQRFFCMTPSLLGERAVKLGARPVACGPGALAEAAGAQRRPDDLRAGMRAWLETREACFRFTVHPQADADMPVEDPTVLWDEARSPPVAVATIRIPPQRFDGAAQQAYCENLSFTPWHSLPEHRPLGGVNRMRKAVYLAVSTLRHRLNGAPRVEPTAIEPFP
jgi:hypothetical protein